MRNDSLKVPEAGCVRVGLVGAIPDLLRARGNEPPEKIVADVGLDLSLFENPDNSIHIVDVGRLLNRCVKSTGIQHFGLRVGQQTQLRSLGELAKLAIHAPNAGSALHSMILHVCINDRGGVPTLTSGHGVAKLGYAIYVPMHEGIRQVNDTAMAIICNLLRSLCGEAWAPSEVLFSHAQPDEIEPYTSFFRSPLRFDADEDALVFPDRWLQQPNPAADARQHRMTVARLAAIEAGMGIDLLEDVRSIMRPLLVSRRCSHEHVAHALSLHPRTLDRRLKDLGTNYREIVSELRYELAMQLLMYSEMSATRISMLLGYSDTSVFTRSFRRWSGMTPSGWRTHNQL